MTGSAFLPVADEAQDPNQKSGFVGEVGVRGPKWARMPLLTIGMMGLQIVWSMEEAWASPYLHDELGVKKSFISLVLLAGPLSGLIVQPLVGVLSDRATSRFGRRRPFIAIGGFICITAVLVMGYTRDVASWFTKRDSAANNHLTVALAVISIFCIDFSINAVQGSDRALLVDVLPPQDQPLGNAWAASMFGIGSVTGFFLGSSQLPGSFPFLGHKQLQVLAALSAFIFFAGHAIVAFSVKEKRLIEPAREKITFFGIFVDIWVNIRTLPPVIFQICLIQFFAWVSWFPFLFYMTIYISEIYIQQFDNPTVEQENEGTRLGNRAMFFHAICSLATSVIAPIFIKERGKKKRWAFIDLSMLWSIALLILTCCLMATYFLKTVTSTTILAIIIGISWALTQWAPFALLGEAILSSATLTSSPRSNRIPLQRVNDQAIGEEHEHFLIGDEENDDTPRIRRSVEEDSMEGVDGDEHQPLRSAVTSDEHGARRSMTLTKDIGLREDREEDDEGVGFAVEPPRTPRIPTDNLAAKAGVILGIHNVFLVIPQFLSSAMTAIVFRIYEPGPKSIPDNPTGTTNTTMMTRNDELDDSSPDALGVVFRLGGLCAFVAFVLAWRLSRMLAKTR